MALGIFTNITFNLIGFIPVDCKTVEIHNRRSNVTKLALESGEQISDHVIVEPDELVIDFQLSNIDLPFSNVSSSLGIRAALTYQLLVKMYRDRSLHTIITRHDIYTNMILSELIQRHEAPFSGAIVGTALFKKINFANLANVAIPKAQVDPSVQYAANSISNNGNVVTQALNENTEFYDKLLEQVGL